MQAAKVFPPILLSSIFIFLICFRPVHHDVTGSIARYQNKANDLSSFAVSEHREHRPSSYSVITSSILRINTLILGKLGTFNTEIFFKFTLAIFLITVSLFVTLLILGRFEYLSFFILLFAMGGESWWIAWQPSHLASILCIFLFPLLLSQKRNLQVVFFILVGFVATIKYVTLALPFSLVILDSYFNERNLKRTFINAALVILSGLLWLKFMDYLYGDFEMIQLSFALGDGVFDLTLKRGFEKLFYFFASTPLLLACLFILMSYFSKTSLLQKILLLVFLGSLSSLSLTQAQPHLYHNGGFAILCLVPVLAIRNRGKEFLHKQIPKVVKYLSISSFVFGLAIVTLVIEVPYPLESKRSIYPFWSYFLLTLALAIIYLYTRKNKTSLSGYLLVTLLFLMPFANHGNFYLAENTFRYNSIKYWDDFWRDEGFAPFQSSFLSFGTALDSYLVQQKTNCGVAYGTFVQRASSNTRVKELKKFEKWNRIHNCYKDFQPNYILIREGWFSKETFKRLDIEYNCSLAQSDGKRSVFKCAGATKTKS